MLAHLKIHAHAQFRHAVRRVKRAKNRHEAQSLFDAAMANDMELMKEMKRVKSGKGELDELAETVDGATGEDNVANQFKKAFETLYNSASSDEEMEELKMRIKELLVTADSQAEVQKMTPDIVKQAAMLMKPNKMDVSQGFSSDALLHAPDHLFSILAVVLQDWLTHGTVTKSLLACAFIPLLKGSKDPSSTYSQSMLA